MNDPLNCQGWGCGNCPTCTLMKRHGELLQFQASVRIRLKPCVTCGGTGCQGVWGAWSIRCRTCDGRGKVELRKPVL